MAIGDVFPDERRQWASGTGRAVTFQVCAMDVEDVADAGDGREKA